MIFNKVFQAVDDVFNLGFADLFEVGLLEQSTVPGVAAWVDCAGDIAVLFCHVVSEEIRRRLIITINDTLARA